MLWITEVCICVQPCEKPRAVYIRPFHVTANMKFHACKVLYSSIRKMLSSGGGAWYLLIWLQGLLALSQLLRASTTPAWRGSKLQHLELMGDGQPDSATPNEWVVAKAAAAAAAAAPPAKPSKKAAAGGGASGGGAAATAAAGEGQGGEAGAAAAAAAGGGGGTVGGDSGTSVTPGTPGAGGPTLTSSSSGSGGRGLPCSSSSCDLYATGGSGGGSTWGGGGATGRLGGTLRPSTAPGEDRVAGLCFTAQGLSVTCLLPVLRNSGSAVHTSGVCLLSMHVGSMSYWNSSCEPVHMMTVEQCHGQPRAVPLLPQAVWRLVHCCGLVDITFPPPLPPPPAHHTYTAGGRRTTIIPQALDFPLQLTLAQCSLRSRSSDAESLRAGISSLRTSLELRRADMVKTFDSWQEDQSSKGMIPVCRLGVLEPVVVAGVAVSNPLLNGGYKRYPAPLEEQQEYKQYYQHALVHAPPASPQQQQQQQQQQPPPPPQKQRPQFTPPALQSFALALGVSGLVLTSLVLDHTHLGDTGLSHLLPGLQRCSSLKVLSLQYCGLGPSAASTLSSVLAAGPSVNTGTYSKGYSVGNKAAAAAAAAAAAGGVSGDGSSYGGGTYGDAVPVLELPGHVQYSQTPAGAPSSRLAVGSSSITGEPGSTFLLGSTIPEGRGDWVNPSSSTVKDSAAANQASSSSSSRTPKLEVLQLSGNHLTGVGLSQLAPAIRRSQELKVRTWGAGRVCVCWGGGEGVEGARSRPAAAVCGE
jgi:hypothetical protein